MEKNVHTSLGGNIKRKEGMNQRVDELNIYLSLFFSVEILINFIKEFSLYLEREK